ncbi:MAG: M61 family peptidase [Betaproteobacteria bacterium]|nr:MAG: M61 family peptidase [Betaproteobacteria bacterium]
MPHYRLAFADPAGHVLHVTMTIERPAAVQRVSMPTWIPGSYMIREFSRNIVQLEASQNGQHVSATKLDKASWEMRCDQRLALTISYRVYAWDRSVRSNYFDVARGFVNPAASMLCDANDPSSSCTLDVVAPEFLEGNAWKLATSMSVEKVDSRGFGRYSAATYDEFIDHPLECADFDEFTFIAGGVPHRFVVSGVHRGDLERLSRDAQKICQGHCELFADSGDVTPPFDRYVFQLHVVDDGYGGLEHRASTALICPRNDLPVRGVASISEGYQGLLALISHEYFHAWNVKRIRPLAFLNPAQEYDTSSERYTRLLWLFEGFTSYYDELMLLRVGLITEADYLKLLSRHISQVMRTPARHVQSVADSSFDAWTKYYRQDENAPNAVVSYYVKGGLVALLLDWNLRASSSVTLDDVMRHLWQGFGNPNVGVPEDVFAVFEQVSGLSLRDFEAKFVSGVVEPDWREAGAPFALKADARPSVSFVDRGGAMTKVAVSDMEPHLRHWGIVVGEVGEPTLRYVLNGSAAHAAGLAAGDVLIAIDGLRATRATLSKHVLRMTVGESIRIDYFRHDHLRQTVLIVPTPPIDTMALAPDASAGEEAVVRRKQWLTGAME